MDFVPIDAKILINNQFNLKEKDDIKIDPFKYFFGHVISEINTLDNQFEGYAEHNFSGKHSASYQKSARAFFHYIISNFSGIKNHIDVGASIAALSSYFIKHGFESYAIDGCSYGFKNGKNLIPQNLYAVCDVASCYLNNLKFEKYFDIATTIETSEHIEEFKQTVFWENIRYMSKECFASLHVRGKNHDEYPVSNHYTVKDISWWIDFLSNYGEVKIIDNLYVKHFDESLFVRIKFK